MVMVRVAAGVAIGSLFCLWLYRRLNTSNERVVRARLEAGRVSIVGNDSIDLRLARAGIFVIIETNDNDQHNVMEVTVHDESLASVDTDNEANDEDYVPMSNSVSPRNSYYLRSTHH